MDSRTATSSQVRLKPDTTYARWYSNWSREKRSPSESRVQADPLVRADRYVQADLKVRLYITGF